MQVDPTKDWPIYYHDILRVKNPHHHLGVCTLWTERDVVRKLLRNVEYNTIGNLYSAQGVNTIVRNVCANPNIRTIVIWGSEMSLSGHSLLSFVKNGIDGKRRIIKGRGEIEEEIPDEAVTMFRKNIEVIDMRGRKATEFKKKVQELAKQRKEPFAKKPVTYPRAEPKVEVMPSGQTGYYVRGKTVAQTWLKLLNEIYKYGRPKHTRYAKDNELKEILNLTAVIEDEDPSEVYFPEYLPFERGELEAYYAEIMTDREVPGVAYNYGRRMRLHFDVDQIQKMKELLKERPNSKKMLATTGDPKLDWSRANRGDTPCLVMVLGSVQDSKFFMTAHFRSQDMVHGWPRNTFALRKLQKDIADSAEYPMGPLTMITHSAHIYSDDFVLVGELLMDWYLKEMGYTPSVHFDFDKRGNVVVSIVEDIKFDPKQLWREGVPLAVAHELKRRKSEKQYIKAELFEPDGGPLIREFVGRTPHEVMWQITDWGYIRDPAHAMYVGIELEKAYRAMVEDRKYHQDPA